MQLTLNIPDEYAAVITQLAQADGITPTQWVTRTIKQSVRPAQAKRIGRPTINQERDASIRSKRAQGMSIPALAKEFSLSTVRINQILAAV